MEDVASSLGSGTVELPVGSPSDLPEATLKASEGGSELGADDGASPGGEEWEEDDAVLWDSSSLQEEDPAAGNVRQSRIDQLSKTIGSILVLETGNGLI